MTLGTSSSISSRQKKRTTGAILASPCSRISYNRERLPNVIRERAYLDLWNSFIA